MTKTITFEKASTQPKAYYVHADKHCIGFLDKKEFGGKLYWVYENVISGKKYAAGSTLTSAKAYLKKELGNAD